MSYLFQILIIIDIYIILVEAANITIGMSNLMTLCQAAFYGIGAYIGAMLLMSTDIPFVVVALAVILITGLFSLLISYASIRLKGDYFIIATLGFQMIIFTLMNNLDITGGAQGIMSIPSIKLFNLIELKGLHAKWAFLTTITVAIVLLSGYLIKSPFGRTLRAIRTDETAMVSLGRNTAMYKSWAFFISAGLSGLAGVLYASYTRCIYPSYFTLDMSIFILSALFIGGTGNVRGPLIGALLVVVLQEALRYIGPLQYIAADLKYILYGLLLIVFMFFRPEGIAGTLSPNSPKTKSQSKRHPKTIQMQTKQ